MSINEPLQLTTDDSAIMTKTVWQTL